VIPRNMEKYVAIIQHIEGSDIHFRFLDSFRFMASSLDKLASYLQSTPITRQQFLHLDEETFKILARKGVYPYEYTNSLERLEETELPSKENFFSKLTGSGITDADYEHAQRVWRVSFYTKTITTSMFAESYE